MIVKSKYTYIAIYIIVFSGLVYMANTSTRGYGFAALFWGLLFPSILAWIHEAVNAGCRHVPVDGYLGKPTYGSGARYSIDNMGTMHMRIHVKCAKCGEDYHLVNLHVWSEKKVDKPYGVCYRTPK